MPCFLGAQNIAVSGYVIDKGTGEVIKYASVFDSSSGIGTITNNQGYYHLLLKPEKLNLKFSSSGFEPVMQYFQLKNDTILSIQMVPDTEEKNPEKVNAASRSNHQTEKETSAQLMKTK